MTITCHVIAWDCHREEVVAIDVMSRLQERMLLSNTNLLLSVWSKSWHGATPLINRTLWLNSHSTCYRYKMYVKCTLLLFLSFFQCTNNNNNKKIDDDDDDDDDEFL